MIDSRIGKGNPLGFFVELKVSFDILTLLCFHFDFIGIVAGRRVFFHFGQFVDVFIDFVIFVRVVFALSADDERSARFVNENRVYFVNDTKVESALNFALQIYLHIVAKIVETELVVRTVSDIAVVGGFTRVVVHVGKNRAYGLPQIRIDGTHPCRVALGKIVVDRYDVHTLFRKAVQVGGGNAHERFTFTGFHFGDSP